MAVNKVSITINRDLTLAKRATVHRCQVSWILALFAFPPRLCKTLRRPHPFEGSQFSPNFAVHHLTVFIAAVLTCMTVVLADRAPDALAVE